MPIYEYKCEDCKVIFDLYCSMKDMKKYVMCTECGKRAPRCVAGQSFSFTMEGKTEKFYRSTGEDTSKAIQWHDQEVRNTEKALKFDSGVSPYSRMSINYDEMEKQGVCKKVSSKEAKARNKSTEKMVKDAANKMSEGELKLATRPDRTKSK